MKTEKLTILELVRSNRHLTVNPLKFKKLISLTQEDYRLDYSLFLNWIIVWEKDDKTPWEHRFCLVAHKNDKYHFKRLPLENSNVTSFSFAQG